MVSTERTTENFAQTEREEMKCKHDIYIFYFFYWLTEHSNRFSKEAVGTLSLQTLKPQLDAVLSTPRQVALL